MKKKVLALVFALACLTATAYSTCYITYWTESVPEFTVGVYGSFQLDVCCGTGTYTFQITSGTLPAGLSMTSSGVISGTPTAVADETVFIKVTDSVGCHLTQAFPIRAN